MLLLRPFGFDTLPVWVYNLVSESRFEQAALPALSIIAGRHRSGDLRGPPARPPVADTTVRRPTDPHVVRELVP